ncbi:gap junction delta-3 protein-like [Stegostoma tigrinum]|uniref:gap junction delta-3 protein-like n=1 Tax=Stegostoma tigrinum TaxID=3053191 RepID=UPI00202AFB0C|nr:gap junction delta-3 protein-like [Stegostoma tigrinum]XP_048416709.1 gap junction delta-3 protein-like [Stegostoma tigrinum]XP_048416710.1 gap junction delta-3 protein-like [Stegostoma tigrinum]XP_048416711.1 gap junction delta-3 protein-like [Stegostoma tigrinum]XP_048416712.1 gap junction delta-3 protein-like [Stegostoma tigrinum]
MGEWNFLSDLLDSVKNHSPMLGRIWLLLMVIFRMLVLATVGSDIFEDEQEEFICNTLQPGCKQVCYNKAFPISPFRFWMFHIVILSIPTLLFVVYAVHQSSKKKPDDVSLKERKGLSSDPPKLQKFYLIHVILRLLTEIGLVVSQFLIYGFTIEPQFLCFGFPCPHTVDCFVSRPMEKTVFLMFYFVIGVISATVSFVELVHVFRKLFCGKPLKACEQQNRSNSNYEKGRDPHAVRLMEKKSTVTCNTNYSDVESSHKSKSLGSSNSVRSSQSSTKKPPLHI